MTPSLDTISSLDRPALIALWREVFEGPVPERLSNPFLRRFLAFELQSRGKGGLPKDFMAHLAKHQHVRADASSTKRLKPGGRLVREWNGATHIVDVVDDGFIWNGQRHRSLSAIAHTITGARWSGPRFFGLRVQK